jgi:hypothetical protein
LGIKNKFIMDVLQGSILGRCTVKMGKYSTYSGGRFRRIQKGS